MNDYRKPLTSKFLLSRGFCCNNGCKNCPYKLSPCRWCGVIPKLTIDPGYTKIYVTIACVNNDCPLDTCFLQEMIITNSEEEFQEFVNWCFDRWNNCIIK